MWRWEMGMWNSECGDGNSEGGRSLQCVAGSFLDIYLRGLAG